MSSIHDIRRALHSMGYRTRANKDGTYTVRGLWPRRHSEFALYRLWEGLAKVRKE